MIIDAYKITITKAWRMDEQGSHYSLEPWSGDTRDYEGDSEPVKADIGNGKVVDCKEYGKLIFFPGDEKNGYSLSEAIALGKSKILE